MGSQFHLLHRRHCQSALWYGGVGADGEAAADPQHPPRDQSAALASAEPEPETSTVPAADGGVELQNTEQMKETLAQMQKSLAELQKQIENMQKALAGMQ